MRLLGFLFVFAAKFYFVVVDAVGSGVVAVVCACCCWVMYCLYLLRLLVGLVVDVGGVCLAVVIAECVHCCC